MAYRAEITESNPSCFVFLIDQSGSMQDPFGGDESGKTKGEIVAEAINGLLGDLVVKCARSEGVRDYYYVSLIGYGSEVGPAFAGALSGRVSVPIGEIARQPARLEERTRQIGDGAGGFLNEIRKLPVWFDAKASDGTPMCAAMDEAHAILSNWLGLHPHCYPPIVINITDGESTDGDPTNAAAAIRSLRSIDGNVLLFNLHLSSSQAPAVHFPNSEADLVELSAKQLFRLTSPLPDSFKRMALEEGRMAPDGAKGFLFNANPRSMIRFLQIGTGPPSLRFSETATEPRDSQIDSVARLQQPYDDDVTFTVYRPNTVVPQKWYSLLAFAHLSARRSDADEDEPDPMVEVQRQAKQMLGQQVDDYIQTPQQSGSAVPRSGEITFKPYIKDVEFNPPSRSFRWEESVHREEFKLRAPNHLDGQVARGWLRAYLGPLVLAQVNLAIRIDSKHANVSAAFEAATDSSRPLRKVFASYSHHDQAIVEQIEEHLRHAHLGIEYLRDATKLRAGEEWSPRLREMIGEANAFQLFWSTNSMHSKFVREEYEYALSLQRQNFVLPVYWETPFPERPEENLPPKELRRLHFERLVGLSTGRLARREGIARSEPQRTEILKGGTARRKKEVAHARKSQKKIKTRAQPAATGTATQAHSAQSLQINTRVRSVIAIGLALALAISILIWLKTRPEPGPAGYRQIVITAPKDWANVGEFEEVRGFTPFKDMNHYIIVNPGLSGIDYVQQTLVLRDGDRNSFSGVAKFGGPNVERGEHFTIRVLATKSTLQTGSLLKLPPDALVSDSVRVRRFR